MSEAINKLLRKDVVIIRIIAIDFDGTLCVHKFPLIGEPNENVINAMKEEQANGAKFILWTVRSGKYLDEALRWCAEHDLYFDAVNENIPEIQNIGEFNSPKVLTSEYWDDRAVIYKDGVLIK